MSETTLSEERLSELLTRYKQTLESPGSLRTGEAGCLGLEQIRRRVLTGAATADEERHLVSCRRCARLLEQMQAQMPHLPIRVLLGSERNLLSPTEQRATDRHLSPDGCHWCHARAGAVHRLQKRVADWHEPLPLPHPNALAAGTRGLTALATATDAGLEAEFTEEGSRLVLEVRTHDPRLNYSLVSFLLYGRQRRSWVEGFTVLRPDVDGWFTGFVSFGKGDLYSRLSGCCERILVSPVEPLLLSPSERNPLLTSLPAPGDASAFGAWGRWLAEAERQLEAHPDSLHPSTPSRQLTAMLAEVRSTLEPTPPPQP